MNRPQNGKYGKFWEKVRRTACCWIWEGAKEVRSGSKGTLYGKAWFQGKLHVAHRVAWQLTNGPIPIGKLVLHQCDVAVCVNPWHLYIGDVKDNGNDRANIERTLRVHRNCHPPSI